MRSKIVQHAYATSITANKHHKPDGCWLVEVGEGSYLPCVDSQVAYDTEREAIDAAAVLPVPWSDCWINAKRSEMNYHLGL